MYKITTDKLSFLMLSISLPITHLYLYNSAIQRIPRIPFSFFGPLLFLLTSILIFTFLNKKNVLDNRDSLLQKVFFYLFLLYCIAIVLLYIIFPEYLIAKSFSVSNLNILLRYLIYFTIGYYLRNIEHVKFSITLFFFLLIVSTMTNINPKNFIIDFSNVLKSLSGIYLFLGDSFAIWSLLMLSILKKDFFRYIVILISIVCLFILTSRTSLYSYIFTTIIIISFNINKKWLLLFIPLSIILVIQAMGEFSLETILSSRQFNIILGRADSSGDARTEFLLAGISDIKKYPLTGLYGGQILKFGNSGPYIHNFISIWRQFGFVAFLLFMLLCFKSWLIAFKIFINFKNNPEPIGYFYLILTIFLSIEILVARSYGSPYIAMVFGLAASLKERKMLNYEKFLFKVSFKKGKINFFRRSINKRKKVNYFK